MPTEPVDPVGQNIERVFNQISDLLRTVYFFLGKNQALNGDAIVENQTDDYAVLLGYDERPGFTAKSNRLVYSGVPGTITNKQVVVEGSAIIRNMTMICEGNTPALLVKETGKCILENCHIVKLDNLQTATDSYVSVENAGVLNVVGCMFHGAQTAGFVVSNPAPAPIANVDVTGCVNLTGRLHDNVTVVGEVP